MNPTKDFQFLTKIQTDFESKLVSENNKQAV